ncbi:hypothetical protein TTHERM_01026170 (macronuclear) [Tetrahymena thermophila SB210]|uniref:Cell surface immobilization antigen n=1 Tax=Tetrahymena thermophila (strain SB210) TaxID=312017 RepID=Q22CR2_TETTS|nr:hypothetical protein TTHERM_01026170 [Tetrahymena thermophila SB210]EAR83053.1 hypothetical protein TTHERM_01026170 [Tetrahymena thermophila SB210]|eukprot:XP_001030716.1 hypothetical protein TTHERM_01026170 [Tetrahymena thermophila SB210]
MKSIKPILYLLLVNQIFTIGLDVTCSDTTCTTPGACGAPPTVPSGLSWQNSSTNGKCAISNCPASGTDSGLIGATDLFCQSCPGTEKDSIKAVHANAAQTACVASLDTCGKNRPPNSWGDNDCLTCFGASLRYARADQTGCQATIPNNYGNDITCSSTLPWSCDARGGCPQVPTFPINLKWDNGSTNGKCKIYDCPPDGTNSGLVGASDLFCQSCPGTSKGSLKAVFANEEMTGCAASSFPCIDSKRPGNSWTNADCLACFGPTKQYGQIDGTGCEATPPPANPGADVTCGNGPVNCPDSGVCSKPPTGLKWQIGSVYGKCSIRACPLNGTDSGVQGASDLFCQSCPGTSKGSIKAVHANFDMTACVASQYTCDIGRPSFTWTDSECLACFGQTKNKATKDGSECYSAPSTPQIMTSSSQIIFISTIIFILSMLF